MVLLQEGGGAHQDQVGLPEDQLDGCLGGRVSDGGAALVEDVVGKVMDLVVLDALLGVEVVQQLDDGLLWGGREGGGAVSLLCQHFLYMLQVIA